MTTGVDVGVGVTFGIVIGVTGTRVAVGVSAAASGDDVGMTVGARVVAGESVASGVGDAVGVTNTAVTGVSWAGVTRTLVGVTDESSPDEPFSQAAENTVMTMSPRANRFR
jgi:hypothetical protein